METMQATVSFAGQLKGLWISRPKRSARKVRLKIIAREMAMTAKIIKAKKEVQFKAQTKSMTWQN